MRRQEVLGRDRDEAREALVQDRDESKTLSTLPETRLRRYYVLRLSRDQYVEAWLLCGGKYRRNSIENDYCGVKPRLSPLPLILTLTLTLNPNPMDLTNPKPNPTDPTNPKWPTTNRSLPPQ